MITGKRTALVLKGLNYHKRSQIRAGGSWIPRYSLATASRETAFRHVRKRYKGDRKCWCTNWFVEGEIKRIIGDYGDIGDYGEEDYPDCCNANDMAIKNYVGIKYEVRLCQGQNRKIYICLPSDFAEYEVGDKVIIFMRGVWENSILSEPARTPGDECQKPSCKACRGNKRPEQTGEEADGSFLIMPLEIAGVNI